MYLNLLYWVTYDMIKRNESDVGNIDFEIAFMFKL